MNIIQQIRIIIIIGLMSQQSPRQDDSKLLEHMTTAMKQLKLVLHQLQSQYRSLHFQNTIKDLKIEDRIGELAAAVAAIEGCQCKKMLSTRLVNRFLEIVVLYRNRFSECEATLGLRDQLCTVFALIKEYQTAYHNCQSSNQNHNPSPAANPSSTSPQLVPLFDKICNIFSNSLRELRVRFNKSNYSSLDTPIYGNKAVQSSQLANSGQSRQKDKDRDRDRRNSFPESPSFKSMEYKYRVTKEIIGNVGLFAGMDIDVSHLRGLFIQANNNFTEIHEDKLEANQTAIRCRDQFLQAYNQWRLKVKRKASRKQKLANCSRMSPNKTTKNSQNKSSMFSEKPSSLMTKTLTKMPRITQYNASQPQPQFQYQQQDKKRKQFKNMQALTFNRQFIHLSEIKNQKIARRPYAEVKQVLVAGDQLSYYSNNNKNGEGMGQGQGGSSKISFFMQRAVKNQKIVIRKKSINENSRLATEE